MLIRGGHLFKEIWHVNLVVNSNFTRCDTNLLFPHESCTFCMISIYSTTSYLNQNNLSYTEVWLGSETKKRKLLPYQYFMTMKLFNKRDLIKMHKETKSSKSKKLGNKRQLLKCWLLNFSPLHLSIR